MRRGSSVAAIGARGDDDGVLWRRTLTVPFKRAGFIMRFLFSLFLLLDPLICIVSLCYT